MSASAEHAFAVVEAVEAEGLRLKFDGEDEAGEKLYKCNTFFKFSVGDRVYCVKDSGTFVAICKIGAPAQEITADKATEADTVESAETSKTAKKAEAVSLVGISASDVVRFRKAGGANEIEYAYSYDGKVVPDTWFSMGSPRDGSVTYENVNGIIKFRSTSAGKLEFCLPYRSTVTWYTVATE